MIIYFLFSSFFLRLQKYKKRNRNTWTATKTTTAATKDKDRRENSISHRLAKPNQNVKLI